MAKISIDERTAYVIRSQRPGRRDVYFEAHNVWNASPAHATIFRTYETATSVLCDHTKMVGRQKDERIDAVPMYALLTGRTDKPVS